MCGLTGFWHPGGGDRQDGGRIVTAMRDRLAHRGPDDAANWRDEAAGLHFGFRRLSIVDLSAAGRQPMVSADGRHVLMMNGEIYNARDLRSEIEGLHGAMAWRGHSDTEILLEAIAAWGLPAALARVNGMFALAVWDRRDRVLSLARDRIGKKPLHYGWVGGAFLFGSELKALQAYPGFDDRICAEALSGFLRIGYVAGRRTIFQAISRLPAGHMLRLDSSQAARRATPPVERYWDLQGIAQAGLEAQASGQPAGQDELEALVADAVARRMVADVPVGSFLSGGIDSSLVTAVMARHQAHQVHSFAIGFQEPEWDEAPYARAVAAHLGTRHTALYLGPAEILGMIRDIAEISDEPLADDSIVPTTLLCRLARREVVVALSGDGGDELFGGYGRYAAVETWLARAARLPGAARAAAGLASALLADPAERLGYVRSGRRLRLLAELLRSGDAEAVHRMVVSQTLDADALLAQPAGAPHPLDDAGYRLGRSTPVDRMGFMDMASYLTDDILTKVDRASMSASLEVRCPLLDYRLIELAWRFPPQEKYHAGIGKRPLRRMLARHVPESLTDRPKRGFGAPFEAWLKDGLRDWAEGLMSEAALGRHGLLDVAACRRLWLGFQQRNHSLNRVLVNLLLFQAWHAALRTSPSQPVPDAPRLADGGAAVRRSAAR